MSQRDKASKFHCRDAAQHHRQREPELEVMCTVHRPTARLSAGQRRNSVPLAAAHITGPAGNCPPGTSGFRSRRLRSARRSVQGTQSLCPPTSAIKASRPRRTAGRRAVAGAYAAQREIGSGSESTDSDGTNGASAGMASRGDPEPGTHAQFPMSYQHRHQPDTCSTPRPDPEVAVMGAVRVAGPARSPAAPIDVIRPAVGGLVTLRGRCHKAVGVLADTYGLAAGGVRSG